MIDVGEHGDIEFFPLSQDGVDIALDDIEDVGAALCGDGVPEIGCVDVDGGGEVSVGNFGGGDEEEPTGLIQERFEFGKGFEADLRGTLVDAFLDPRGAEAISVFGEGFASAYFVGGTDPTFSFEEHVVVGEREEMVAVVFVPGGDHLGVVIAIAPERVGVEVPFEPSLSRGDGGRGLAEQGARKDEQTQKRQRKS